MSCSCNKNKIDAPYSNKKPNTHCVFCAEKHFSTALALSRETGYERINKYFIIGELVLAQWHLYTKYPYVCEKIRKIRHLYQEGKWKEASPICEDVCDNIEQIKETELSQTTYDVIIPYKTGASVANDIELRYALRSIEKHLKNYRNIWVAGISKPVCVSDAVKFVPVKDGRGSKQMNIHDAIKTVFNTPGCADNLIFWADDNAAIADVDALNFPVVATENDMIDYDPEGKWWYRTLRATGDLLKAYGFPTLSYEAHTPIVFNKEKYLQIDREFNYYDNPNGLCYISMYYNRYRIPATHKQAAVKATFQGKADRAATAGKMFIGYNNGGVEGGVLDILAEHFPKPSKYEKAISTEPVYSDAPSIGVVLGTYNRPDLVELQLHYLCNVNNLPVLVHDDASPRQEEIRSVVEKFKAAGHDVEFTTTDTTKGHKPGDLRAFAAGLKWAKERGYELLYKVSHRWVILREWATDAIQLAKSTDGLTFSNYTTSFNKGFRTEFQGMNVNAWYKYVSNILELAQRNPASSVEANLHKIAKEISGEVNQKCWDYMMSQNMASDKQGYVQIPWMGTDRKNPPADILWHDAAPDRRGDEMYAESLNNIRKVIPMAQVD